MILVDTSVWIDHFSKGNAALRTYLEEGIVYCHPFVIGEIACGMFRNRRTILTLLERLPSASESTHDEALRFLDARRLSGVGLGWIDVHLLASAVLQRCALWTLDRRLSAAAATLGVGHPRS